MLARDVHDLAVDTVHDEIVVPNPFGQAILFFRGDAKGAEKPLRVIQGPKTLLDSHTDVVDVDPIHNEVFVPQFLTDSILVFSREARGDVAPIRIIHGPKTKMDRPDRISVDPVNNLLAITSPQGLWIFDRTDNGDVAPRSIITGPKTGLNHPNSPHGRVILYPKAKKIFLTGGAELNDKGERFGFLGIWNYGDTGDIAPWAMLKSSPASKLKITGGSFAINPAAKELLITSGGGGGVFVYRLPEVF